MSPIFVLKAQNIPPKVAGHSLRGPHTTLEAVLKATNGAVMNWGALLALFYRCGTRAAKHFLTIRPPPKAHPSRIVARGQWCDPFSGMHSGASKHCRNTFRMESCALQVTECMYPTTHVLIVHPLSCQIQHTSTL